MRDPIPVTRSAMPDFDEYVREIADLWDSRWLTNMGEKHNRLEQQLCELMGCAHVALFTNGHLALETAIQSLGLTGEVITTPFTFASTTQAIVRNGLTPVFCDISPVDYTMDVTKIEPLITPRTSAIVPVHVYGNVCQNDEIERIAKKYGLKVVYDAAHAFGESKDGVNVGNYGDLSMFSFHATKVFHTIEGGCVVCHDDETYRKLNAMKNFGIYGTEQIGETSGNAKMNEFQAAMGLCNLRGLKESIAARGRATAVYRERLGDVPGLTICPVDARVESNYAYFPIVIDPEVFGIDRDTLQARLREKHILTRKYFYPLTSSFDCYQGKFEIQPTPVAEQISARVLALPMYAELTEAEADYVCRSILEERG